MGLGGAVVHTTDGGQSWKSQSSGITRALHSIYGTSDGAQLWAVGDDGTFLHYTAQSGRWEAPSSGTTNIPYSIYGTSIYGTSDGAQLWAVGYGGTILHYTTQAGRWEVQSSGPTSILRSIYGTSDGAQLWAVGDDGTILHYTAQAGRWEAQSSSTTRDLYSIYGTSDGAQLWAVGYGGTILHYTAQSGRWEAQSSGTPNILHSIYGTSDGAQLWAVGYGGTILHYTAQSGRWEAQSSGTPTVLYSIYGTSDGAQLWAVGYEGTILHYTAQSGRWEAQSSGATRDLYSIYGTSDGAQLWAVGYGGETILHYAAQAGGWEAQSSGTTNILYSIYRTSDGAQLWAVGSGGTILHYAAQAGGWEAQSSGTTRDLYSIYGTSDGAQLWAVGDGGTILHYTAQAGRWEAQSSGTTNILYSIYRTSDGAQLWAVGSGGTILHYAAQAGRWEAQSSGTTSILRSIYGTSDGAQLWAVGETILHYTAQAGRWEVQSSGPTSILRSIYGTSDGAQLWAVGETILHYTAQSGRWEARSSGTPNILRSIYGTSDGAQLWAVGSGGTILHTTDGGRTWNRQGYRRWPAPWLGVALLVCAVGLIWATLPLAAPPTKYIEDFANADSPVAQLKYDALGYKSLVTRLLRFIQNPKTKPPLVLAIQAPWGMGKSSVMAMLQTELKEKKAAVSVWFNAWHHQKEDQLLAYLLEAVQKQVAPTWFSAVGLKFRFNLLRVRMFSGPERFLATVAALGLLVFYRPIAEWVAGLKQVSDFLQQHPRWPVTGLPAVLLGILLLANQLRAFSSDPQKLLEQSTRSLWRLLRDLFVFPTLQGKTDVRQEFAKNLKEVTDALVPQRLVIFLDDLDRCRPEQVVQIMEAINFLSSAAPCFIVVGADYQKVQTLVGQYFEPVAVQEAENAIVVDPTMSLEQKDKPAIEARQKYAKVYMRKIVNMRLDLPKPEAKGYADLIRQAGETAGGTLALLQQLSVGSLLVLCLGMSVALATGWLQLPSFGKPEQAVTRAGTSLPVEAGNVGNAPAAAARGGQQSNNAPPVEKLPHGAGPEDRNAIGVLWDHRLTIWVPLLIVLFVAVRYFSRPKGIEKAVDSKSFSEALDRMAPKIQQRCGTPREVRRFQNYLRFLAAWDDSSVRPKVDGLEGDLVVLAATGIKSQDGSDRTDIRGEVIQFFTEQCKMLGLDPNTFQPTEEGNTHDSAGEASM